MGQLILGGKANQLLIWRLIAIFGAVLLLSTLVYSIVYNDYGNTPEPQDFFPSWSLIALNTVGLCVFSFLIFKPLKLELYGLFSFIYAVQILVDGYAPLIGILMYILSMTTLYVRGFFRKKPKLKIICASILFICLVLSGILYGLVKYLDGFIQSIGHLFFIVILSFVIFDKLLTEKKYSCRPVL